MAIILDEHVGYYYPQVHYDGLEHMYYIHIKLKEDFRHTHTAPILERVNKAIHDKFPLCDYEIVDSQPPVYAHDLHTDWDRENGYGPRAKFYVKRITK
jgi:hypothetical protein